MALGGVIDSKSSQLHHRDGVAGQVFHYPGWRLGMGDGADRQAVITDHPIVGNGDTDLRAAGRLVVEGEAAKVSIEVFVPAVERIDRVGAVQFADWPACRGGGITGPS